MTELDLADSHKHAISARLQNILESAQLLRGLGVDGRRLDALEAAVRETRAMTGTPPPPRLPSLVPATIATMMISAIELKPQHLGRYGALAGQQAEEMDLLASRLLQLVNGLVDDEPSAPESEQSE